MSNKQAVFNQFEIKMIEGEIHKNCRTDLSTLPRRMQKALMDLGGVTSKLISSL